MFDILFPIAILCGAIVTVYVCQKIVVTIVYICWKIMKLLLKKNPVDETLTPPIPEIPPDKR